MITLITTLGWILIPLGFIHVIFPRYFRWREELPKLQLINRELMVVHTFFIALMVILIGLLCISSARELVETALGRRICGGLAIFWGCRLAAQFLGYSTELWRGKTFETVMHVVFTLLWVALTTVFAVAAF